MNSFCSFWVIQTSNYCSKCLKLPSTMKSVNTSKIRSTWMMLNSVLKMLKLTSLKFTYSQANFSVATILKDNETPRNWLNLSNLIWLVTLTWNSIWARCLWSSQWCRWTLYRTYLFRQIWNLTSEDHQIRLHCWMIMNYLNQNCIQ